MGTREHLLAEQARIATRLALLDRYPAEDPYEDGQVVAFERRLRRLDGSGRIQTYSYAAIKAGGRWYTTGGTCPRGGMSWSQFVDWLNSGGEASELRALSEQSATPYLAGPRTFMTSHATIGDAINWRLAAQPLPDARNAKKLFESLQVIWANLQTRDEPLLVQLLEYIQRAERDPSAHAELLQAAGSFLLMVAPIGTDLDDDPANEH